MNEFNLFISLSLFLPFIVLTILSIVMKIKLQDLYYQFETTSEEKKIKNEFGSNILINIFKPKINKLIENKLSGKLDNNEMEKLRVLSNKLSLIANIAFILAIILNIFLI